VIRRSSSSDACSRCDTIQIAEKKEELMTEVYILKNKLLELVALWMTRYRVLAPVVKGDYHEFMELTRAEDLNLDFQNTRLSPKELFQPQSEKMFRFTTAGDDAHANVLHEVEKDYSPRLMFGIRPCDARALRLVDLNFDTAEYRDPWWVERRKSTLLVGLGCNAPCPTCFCTAVESGPFDASGLDVLLTELNDGYVARACGERGEALLAELESTEAVTREQAEAAAKAQAEAERMVARPFDASPLSDKAMTELFNSPFWEEVAFSCINCGTCTFLCPTCWCFDIQDEVHANAGVRLRNWDSCMFPLFTLHGSGHNPRQQKPQRVRQRFMHKFKYYIDKYGDGPACVGCGRCVQFCPVNIDIRQVVSLMSARCVCPA
jgi:sulfhydrogenase subunit beta (sulfur reductase)